MADFLVGDTRCTGGSMLVTACALVTASRERPVSSAKYRGSLTLVPGVARGVGAQHRAGQRACGAGGWGSEGAGACSSLCSTCAAPKARALCGRRRSCCLQGRLVCKRAILRVGRHGPLALAARGRCPWWRVPVENRGTLGSHLGTGRRSEPAAAGRCGGGRATGHLWCLAAGGGGGRRWVTEEWANSRRWWAGGGAMQQAMQPPQLPSPAELDELVAIARRAKEPRPGAAAMSASAARAASMFAATVRVSCS